LERFGWDEQAEATHHRDELKSARSYVRGLLPELQVDCFFVNFEGVWETQD